MTAATATIRSAVIIAVLLVSAGAFSPSHVATRNRFNVNLFATTQESGTPQSSCCSRRSFWHQSASLAVSTGAVLMGNTPSVLAASLSQEDVDKQKIKKGYERLTYLLDNWEAETSICNTGTDKQFTGCERTPMKVMEYLGYRSVDDPLFKADKTLRRLEALVPANEESDYLDAVELWAEKADEGNGLAYVSSWGEANPGGGKDRVAYYIERSKNNVIVCRDALATVMRILQIE